jgi:ubiquinone/menaquinone biosynthesis C-methylase UbiE
MQTKEQIKKTWNDIAKKYGSYHRKFAKELDNFLKEVDSNLLDLGAGDCANTRIILERSIKLYAVDFSEEMLKNAPEKAIKICSDVTKIPLKKKFKYITAIAVIHCLPTDEDRINFLKEVKRLLAPGGQALITSWDYPKKGHIHLLWGKIKRDYYFLSKSELQELLEKVGIKKFTIERIKTSQGPLKPCYNFFIKIIG